MILQIEGREPDDFKNKPTEDVKGACCNAEVPMHHLENNHLIGLCYGIDCIS